MKKREVCKSIINLTFLLSEDIYSRSAIWPNGCITVIKCNVASISFHISASCLMLPFPRFIRQASLKIRSFIPKSRIFRKYIIFPQHYNRVIHRVSKNNNNKKFRKIQLFLMKNQLDYEFDNIKISNFNINWDHMRY